MFKSIKYLKYDGETNKYVYWLEDPDFSCEVAGVPGVTGAAGTVLEYKKRNLPIVKNLALFYLFYKKKGHNVLNYLDFDKDHIDKHCPELNYGTTIYPLVKEKIDILGILG